MGYYVDFSGDGSQADLFHVACVCIVSQQSLKLHVTPHLVAINASMASNGYTIWWTGNKSLLVIPQCAISEGQGTVHFPQAEKRNKSNKYFMQLELPDILTPFAFFYKLNQGQICGQSKMKVRTEYTAHSNSHKIATNHSVRILPALFLLH